MIGTEEVFFAVVATTLVLIAVFVPLSFLPGQSGGLFREFGFTLAIAISLSAVVALTLCPVLAARLLTREGAHVERRRGRLARLYQRTLAAALAAPLVVVTGSLLFAATAAMMLGGIRGEVTPREDRGDGDAVGHHAAGGLARLHLEPDARDRGAAAAAAR